MTSDRVQFFAKLRVSQVSMDKFGGQRMYLGRQFFALLIADLLIIIVLFLLAINDHQLGLALFPNFIPIHLLVFHSLLLLPTFPGHLALPPFTRHIHCLCSINVLN